MQQISSEVLSYDLKTVETQAEKKKILRENYPDVYIKSLHVLGKKRELNAYFQYCKKQRDSGYENYSVYVHGYLLPLLRSMRHAGSLKTGKKKIFGGEGQYEGELDSYCEPCGFGIATYGNYTYEGSFLNGVFDGFGVKVTQIDSYNSYKTEGEFKQGMCHGKHTHLHICKTPFRVMTCTKNKAYENGLVMNSSRDIASEN